MVILVLRQLQDDPLSFLLCAAAGWPSFILVVATAGWPFFDCRGCCRMTSFVFEASAGWPFFQSWGCCRMTFFHSWCCCRKTLFDFSGCCRMTFFFLKAAGWVYLSDSVILTDTFLQRVSHGAQLYTLYWLGHFTITIIRERRDKNSLLKDPLQDDPVRIFNI